MPRSPRRSARTDFMRELRGIWLAEMSELDSLRGREASTVKRLLSAPTDRFVQKYALHADSYPRRAIAVATHERGNLLAGLDRRTAAWSRSLRTNIRVDLIAAQPAPMVRRGASSARRGWRTWWEFPGRSRLTTGARQQVDPWEDDSRGYIVTAARPRLDGQG